MLILTKHVMGRSGATKQSKEFFSAMGILLVERKSHLPRAVIGAAAKQSSDSLYDWKGGSHDDAI
jgi:hypothetical protein